MAASKRSVPVIISIGSNLGSRRTQVARAITRVASIVNVVRISSLWETDPVDSPRDSPCFLNAVVLGLTRLDPKTLLEKLHIVESGLGRVRRAGNSPRLIDLDLILYGSQMIRSPGIEVPHPRFRDRAFVLAPLAELNLPWVDPKSGAPLRSLVGKGRVRRVGTLPSSLLNPRRLISSSDRHDLIRDSRTP